MARSKRLIKISIALGGLAFARRSLVGLVRNPGGAWMKQMARNLLDAYDGFLREKRYLILDRDPLPTKEFRQMLRGASGSAAC
jgi:hypothetical protein